jgi:hypothetical protein
MTVTGEGRGVVVGCDEIYWYLVTGREYVHTYSFWIGITFWKSRLADSVAEERIKLVC